MNKHLTPEQKLEIAFLSRTTSLRALAEKYGVHHSTIDEICKESAGILQKHWLEKSQRKGRPRKSADTETLAQTQSAQAKASFEKELALKQMRIDYLELRLKWEHERAEQAGIKKNKHQKKKRKNRTS